MKSIVFDFDGTLLDSRFRHQKVLFEIIRSKDDSIHIDQLSDFVAYKANGKNTLNYLIERLGYTSAFSEEIFKCWQIKIEEKEYLKLDKLYNDSLLTIKELYNNYELYIISARNNVGNLLCQIDELDIRNYFKEVLCVSPKDAAVSKYNNVTKFVKSPILIVGDSEIEYTCANMLNINFYALSRGFRSMEWWEAKGIRSFNDFKQIRHYL